MSIQVYIVDGPLAPPTPQVEAGAGAIIVFDGVVRPNENDKPLLALDYQVYEPMATKQLSELAQKMIDRHGVVAIIVTHSRGRVRAGECSFRLQIASKHRKEGLAAMDEFIDRMKQDVPIWKSCVYAEGA